MASDLALSHRRRNFACGCWTFSSAFSKDCYLMAVIVKEEDFGAKELPIFEPLLARVLKLGELALAQVSFLQPALAMRE